MIVDTGPLVAAANRKDDHHLSSVKLLRETWRPMIVPSPVIAEVCHLLERDAAGLRRSSSGPWRTVTWSWPN
jgi:predicted nucleic acid-binding protein